MRDNDLQLSNVDVDVTIQNDATFNALVSTEELLAQIGLAREFATDGKVEHPYVDKLKRVQMILFDLSHAILKPIPGKSKTFESKHINDLEEWIVEYTNQLPPQETYIIPVKKAFLFRISYSNNLYSILHFNRVVVKLVLHYIQQRQYANV